MQQPTGPITVEYAASWIEDYQPMPAFYAVVFDLAGDEFVKAFGMGLEYTARTENSWMVVEGHLLYQNEACLVDRLRGDRLRIESRLLDFDAKRAHLYQEMYREQTLLASQEQMMLHVNLLTRRASPFPPDILAQLEQLRRHHQTFPLPPAAVGRRISVARRT
ncbi:MAG: hypothetical protein EXR86_11270 [Gammaproteobacteria bacterium]|nr:hypothetical protein [Gammaproteobacteria bacterium]